MQRPLSARRVVASALAVCVVAAATACGGAEGQQGQRPDPNAEAAQRLHNAQLVEYKDAKLAPDRSEAGTFSRLATTRQTDKLRKTTDLDKPECMEAANQWAELPEVRKAPASLATYARKDDTITHTLIEAPREATEEVVAAAPPKECDSYEATMKDGSTTSYQLTEVDTEPVADGARAFSVQTEFDKDTVWLYSLVYRNGGYLGMTSVLGPKAEDDYSDTLAAFTRDAVEREDEVLG